MTLELESEGVPFEVVWLGCSTRGCFEACCAAVLIWLRRPVLLAAVLAPAEAILVCCSVLFLSAMWFGFLVFSAVFPCCLWSAYVYALGRIVVMFPGRFCSAFAVRLSYIICCFKKKSDGEPN